MNGTHKTIAILGVWASLAVVGFQDPLVAMILILPAFLATTVISDN